MSLLPRITVLFPLLFGLVTSNFNLTDPCAIGMLIPGDHWSHACKLSRILDPLERGEVYGEESYVKVQGNGFWKRIP